MKKSSNVHVCVLIIVMLYAMTLLQCGECQDFANLANRCNERLRTAFRAIKLKLEKSDNGSFSLKSGANTAKYLKSTCKFVRSLESDDCRCVVQENIRNADSVPDNVQERLEFVEFLSSSTEIATICNIKANVNCSAAADKIITNNFPKRNTKLENDLRRRSRACVDRARQVVPSCRSFIDAVPQTNSSETAVQESSDALQKTCCDAVSGAGLEEDCLCLILEADKANPKAPKPAIEKQMIEVIKFVNADEGRTRKCISNTNKLDCSGVAKALKRTVDLRSLGNAGKDLSDPQKCDKAALEAMEMCASKMDGMGPGNGEKVESLACCNELQRISGAGCGCKLGNTVHTSKDVVGFLERIRSKGENIVKSCSGYKLDGVLNCKKASGNKNATLFDKCEVEAQEVVKTCAAVAAKPIPNTHSVRSGNCEELEKFLKGSCACDIPGLCQEKSFEGFCGSYIDLQYVEDRCGEQEYLDDNDDTQFVSNCRERFNATIQVCLKKGGLRVVPIKPCCILYDDEDCVSCDSQTTSCCEQLQALSSKGVNSCFCKVTQNRVASRGNTAPFLKAHVTGASAVGQTCDQVWGLIGSPCIPPVIDNQRSGYNVMGEKIANSLKSRRFRP